MMEMRLESENFSPVEQQFFILNNRQLKFSIYLHLHTATPRSPEDFV